MKLTLKKLAEIAGGELDGDGQIEITGVAGLKEAGNGQITFLANPKYAKDLAATKASAVIAAPGVDTHGKPCIRAKNPYYAFSKVLTVFAPQRKAPQGIMPGSTVSPTAKLGNGITVYPNAFVDDNAVIEDGVLLFPGVFVGEGSVVGEGSMIYPNVVIREGVRIGKRVIIHSGTVVGSDGFGYATEAGRHNKIPQVGGVVIGDDVEIGSNASIDRGALGDTVIKRGTKIDNLVQVAHNVVIGEDSIIVAQVGISGSTELGHHVVLAGQVGVAGHLKIGDMVTVGAKSGVHGGLDGGQAYSGIPAIPHKDWLRSAVVYEKLPEIRKTLTDLLKRVAEIEKSTTKTEDR
jgi:UDP-3-O-[3-hydroxymyristoyl] glucosamine N-acyltransferase